MEVKEKNLIWGTLVMENLSVFNSDDFMKGGTRVSKRKGFRWSV